MCKIYFFIVIHFGNATGSGKLHAKTYFTVYKIETSISFIADSGKYTHLLQYHAVVV